MTLFFSDMHFGRGDARAERAKEAALVACLRSHAGAVDHLYLLGDVFDQYIEYRYLMPKGFIRFQALLAEWTDGGVPVTYLVGNHDPWHGEYFGQELGVRVVFAPLLEPLYNLDVYMAHGDGVDPAGRLYNRLKPWLRHPLPVSLYKTVLPGDSGFRLARWVNRTFGGTAIKPSTVQALRARAREILRTTSAGTVIMGHSHQPEYHQWPEGRYLNLGSWHESGTFGRLDSERLALCRWNGTCTVEAA